MRSCSAVSALTGRERSGRFSNGQAEVALEEVGCHTVAQEGAAHGAAMRYAFRPLDSLTLLGDDVGDFGNRPDETDMRYSEMVSAYWVQFAKTGNPNGEGLPGWPATTPGNDLLLEFG